MYVRLWRELYSKTGEGFMEICSVLWRLCWFAARRSRSAYFSRHNDFVVTAQPGVADMALLGLL